MTEFRVYQLSQLLGVFKTKEQAYDFCRKLDDAMEIGNDFYTTLKESEPYRIKESCKKGCVNKCKACQKIK